MIVREYGSYCQVISQPAHAWISGQIAASWGGGSFMANEFWDEVYLAALYHDSGWNNWELNPQLNLKTGLPYNFKNVPIEDHLGIWEGSPAYVGLASQYAQLLVSHHVCSLCDMHNFSKDSEAIREKAELFRKSQKALQKRLILELQENKRYEQVMQSGLLQQHKKLISVFDYLSLMICMGTPDEATLSRVPGNEGAVRLHVNKVTGRENHYQITPWPFTENVLYLHCLGKILYDKYDSQEALQSSLSKAKPYIFKATLSARQSIK